jgi:Tfp pilus assembly protein PilF
MRMEHHDSAMYYVHELLALDPENLEALTNKAGLYATLGYSDSAHQVFEEIMARDPNNKAVLFNLTIDWVRQAQGYAEQITRYSKQANEYTNEFNRLVQQGGSQKKRKELEQKRNDAIASLKEAQANSKEAWGQAKSLSERLAGLDSTDYEALYYWGMADFWLEDYAASLMPLEKAVELKPDYCECWQILYYAYARAGQGDMAAQAKEAMENCGR